MLYLRAAAGVTILALLLAGGYASYKAGWRARDSQAIREEALIANAAQRAQEAAADAISKMKVKHITVRQELEKEIRENVVYRDCVASERVFELSNEAITGTTFKPTSDRGVPADSAASQPDL